MDGCNIAMKKNQKYVVQCIKGNNGRFGFGYRHKAGQYVTTSGKGTNNINDAHVYKALTNNIYNEWGLDDEDAVEWEKYYQYVRVVYGIVRMDEMVIIPRIK